jgi:uncharacterized protein (TIGR01777 family)
METVLITGGTGMIGKALTKELLAKNYRVIILTRDQKTPDRQPLITNLSYANWDIEQEIIDNAIIQQADYIIHLAGAGIADKRWTEKRKNEIVESRKKSSALIVKALKHNQNNVKAVVSASAIGWYGEDPLIPNPKPFTEIDNADESFLGETCKEWEASIEPVIEQGIRLVKLRTGIVLSNDGGALKEFKKPLRFGITAILGNGRQMVSWIHIDDLVQVYIYALQNENMKGVYNAVAPNPVPNRKLILQMGKRIKGSFFIPVYIPSLVLEFMLGDMSIEILKSTTVSCDKVLAAGFSFLYPTIGSALLSLKK